MGVDFRATAEALFTSWDAHGVIVRDHVAQRRAEWLGQLQDHVNDTPARLGTIQEDDDG